MNVPTAYDKELERKRKVYRETSGTARDIGPTEKIVNVRRRSSTKKDLRRFCTAYIGEAFNLKFSTIHLEMIARLEEAVMHGALYAFACPRGSGKSTIARAAALWAISHGHSRYVFFIGANASKAAEALEAIKMWIRFLPEYGEDFPEIVTSVQRLGGIANRASGLLSEGNPVLIEWSKSSVVLPTVAAPPNLRGYKGKLAPTSGTVLAVSGLTGDGLRGSLRPTVDGSQIRPDFVLIDDPSTDDSAASPLQNANRERLIAGAVLGMAGPGKKISAVMPCTVIRRGDVADNLLDRTKHPLWRGTRSRMINGWPDDMRKWEKYFEIYKDDALLEPPDFTLSNKYYRKHRKDLDKGIEATWPERKDPGEVSAIQHAMNLYARNPITFWSEYQNEPKQDQEETDFLSASEIMMKQHSHGHNQVPLEVETIKAFIDVQKEMFFVNIWGYSTGFDGYLLNYFTWPEQNVAYFSKANIKQKLSNKYPGMGLEARLYHGLTELIEILFSANYIRQDDKSEMQISRIGIDTGYKTELLRRVYRDSPHRERLTLCMGVGYTAKRRPITRRPMKAGDRKGPHWYYAQAKNSTVRTLDIDTNWYKTFFHQRLATEIGDGGCFSLYQVSNPQQHRLIADHYASEYRVQLEGPYGQVDEWQVKPSADNDWLDCAVGCAAIASFDGIKMYGADHVETNEVTRRKRSIPAHLKG